MTRIVYLLNFLLEAGIATIYRPSESAFYGDDERGPRKSTRSLIFIFKAKTLPAGDGAEDDQRLFPGDDGFRQRRVRRIVGHILLAGEESEERAPLLRDMIADRAT
jgi:hypothetical protein